MAYSTVTLQFVASCIHISGRENKLLQSVPRTGKRGEFLFAYPREVLRTNHNLGFYPTTCCSNRIDPFYILSLIG